MLAVSATCSLLYLSFASFAYALPTSDTQHQPPTQNSSLELSITHLGDDSIPFGHINPPGLTRRTLPPGALWGTNNVPDIGDIHQTTLQGCGVLSALLALVYVDTKWITNLVTFTGDPHDVKSVTINLFDAQLAPKPKLIVKANLIGPRSDSQEGWWVGAVEQAIRETTGTISLFPTTAMQMLTGRPGKIFRAQHVFPGLEGAIDKEQAWSIIRNSPREPMIFQSLPWGTKNIISGHAYGLVGGHGGIAPGEKRWITFNNPWGNRETWDLEVIWQDCYLIHALANGPDEQPAAVAPAPLVMS